MSKLIILDPGHGGSDPGAVGNGLKEKDLNLVISLATRDALIKDYAGCTVKMTRTKDVYVALSTRAAMGKGADLFVSQHNNAFSNTAARGFETFCYNGTVYQKTLDYRKAIHNAIYPYLKGLGVPDRGMKRQNHFITRVPACPVTLVEYLFVTNATDAALLKKTAVLKELGRLTAVGIAKALGLKKKVVVAPKPAPEPAPKPAAKLPAIIREIDYYVNGKKTSEPAYLINNSTFTRALYTAEQCGGKVEPGGDRINLITPKGVSAVEIDKIKKDLTAAQKDLVAARIDLATAQKDLAVTKSELVDVRKEMLAAKAVIASVRRVVG